MNSIAYRHHVTPTLGKTQKYFYKFKMASFPTKRNWGMKYRRY